ncbi:hypothetical protein GS424_011665 [Eggerthella guodeyinii]|uniref:Glycosyltransferase RgtA/B/C/D-like domain-containing protein n=1 Tax=Eggerthella guodeyinii TaxID=2690837 RepID=A0A6L7IYV1_9ACTN|nr:DUF6020 family protein [Eggerthella guodeyinii]QOS67186.1 hypothetical protein GS424_011665 [Eggerthella guodeyinii]
MTASYRLPRALAYLVASLLMGLSVGLANGFIVALDHESSEPFPELSLGGFDGNSLGFSLAIAALLYLLLCCADRGFASKSTPSSFSAWIDKNLLHSILRIMLVIGIAWLPIIIILYPGIVYHDTEFQLIQFFGNENLNVYSGAPDPEVPKITDHHPIMTTLLFSFFAWLGGFLGGAYNGLFLYALFQATLLAASLAWMIKFLRSEIRVKPAFCGACLMFCGLMPLFPIYAVSISKDAIFAPFFVLFSVLYCWLMLTRGQILSDKRTLALFCTTCLGFVATKKLGIYLLLICLIIALAYCRKGRLAVAASGALSAFAVLVFIPVVVFPLVGGGSGSSREMFSVPFAQTAWYVSEYPEDVTDSEKDVIDEVLGYDSLPDRYAPETADFVKGSAKIEGKVAEYARVYIAEGLRHPLTYLRAFLALEAGFVSTKDGFSPLSLSVAIAGLDTQALPDIYYKPEALEWPAYYIGEFASSAHEIPLLGILFSKGLYAFLAPLCAVLILVVRDRRKLITLLPYIGFAALLYLSPISTEYNSGRYVFPLLCAFPLLLGVIVRAVDNGKPTKGDCELLA